MVYESELDDYLNGNLGDLDRTSLIRICIYFQEKSRGLNPEIMNDLEAEKNE